ncbi:MAG: putative quinol monooxygenase, partial [Limisphaerales bacterium]
EWRAHEGSEDEVADLFRKLEVASRQEPGCLLYVVHRNVADQRRFFIYEQYRDEAAVDAHRNSPHFKEYVVDGVHMIATRTSGELYRPLDED